MGELLILVIVVLALAGCGRACVWGWRRVTAGEDGSRSVEGGAGPALEDGAPHRTADAGTAAGRSREPASAGRGDGGELEELKRRYVEGDITLEQYERALDELDFREEL